MTAEYAVPLEWLAKNHPNLDGLEDLQWKLRQAEVDLASRFEAKAQEVSTLLQQTKWTSLDGLRQEFTSVSGQMQQASGDWATFNRLVALEMQREALQRMKGLLGQEAVWRDRKAQLVASLELKDLDGAQVLLEELDRLAEAIPSDTKLAELERFRSDFVAIIKNS